MLKPVEMNTRVGLIGIVLLLTTIVGLAVKWNEFYGFIVPDGEWLNPRFFAFCVFSGCLVTWVIMNEFWRREFAEHQKAVFERDNFRNLLTASEKKRMTDVVTGIPNGEMLVEDLNEFFSESGSRNESQMILIDIKNFRQVNRVYGFLKGDRLLRSIAQEIYESMRRNEEMYKHPVLNDAKRPFWKTLYRKYPGGDEFVFLIEGDQADALGFVVNRLYPTFQGLTKRTPDILGSTFPLSFHCAIAPVTKRDSASVALARVDDCYMMSAEGKGDFTICWFPTDFERSLPEGDFRNSFYRKARENFSVMNLDEQTKHIDPALG